MADKKDKKEEKKPKPKHKNGGEMSFGMQILLFVIVVFIIWVLAGKPESQNVDRPFIQGQPSVLQ